MISVAMATYNGAKYIKEQIDSILSQTVQNFELVICDDCSKDDTWNILEEYASSDNRIRIFRNSENIGFMKNFEKAVSLCTEKYIALSDQDDIWHSDHLEILLNTMMNNNCDIVCGHPVFVDENNIELPRKFDYFLMDNIPHNNSDTARHILLSTSSYQGASMLIRKTFFEKALPIPEGAYYHDSWFAVLSCFMGGLIYVDTTILRYRRLSSSVTVKTMRVSAFRKIVGVTINKHPAFDRLFLINAIRQRLDTLDDKQKKLLDILEKILKRRDTFVGRIRNFPYLVRHFHAIYATDFLHMFS